MADKDLNLLMSLLPSVYICPLRKSSAERSLEGTEVKSTHMAT